MQHEIENLKRRRTDREDELLVLMEIRESVEADATRARERSETLRARVERVVQESDEELRAVEAELGAAALVDGVCQGCHEQLSAVVLDRLKRTDGVRRCEHCRRILVF